MALGVRDPAGQAWATARLSSHLTVPAVAGTAWVYRHDLGLDVDPWSAIARAGGRTPLRVRLLEGRLAASLSSRELRYRLADRGVMRVRIDRSDQGALGAVRRIAPQARFQGDDIVVPGAAARRPAVLDALRSSCVEVLSLTVEEGRLEDFYRDLVGGKRA